MNYQGDKAICPSRICSHPECDHMIGSGPAVAHSHEGFIYVFHIGCAPVKLRKAYYDRAREEAARGR